MIRVLRCFLLDISMVLTTVIMGICAFPIRWFWPHKALGYAKLWCKIMLFYYRFLGGMRISVKGYEHLQDGPIIIASQHQSGFDTLIWMLLLSKPCYVMKAELTRIPLLGPMLILAGMMPIKRATGVRALRLLLQGTDEAFAHGRQVVIFPQGTRTDPGEDRRLKSGVLAMARHTGCPVYPVATNSGYFWNKRTLYPGKKARDKGCVELAIGPALYAKEGEDMMVDIKRHWQELEQKYDLLAPGQGRASSAR